MPPLIEARNLTKRYGSHTALDHASFVVETGRIVGLIGPNGAGKTSALRALLGLTTYEGDLKVLGRDPFTQRSELMTDMIFIDRGRIVLDSSLEEVATCYAAVAVNADNTEAARAQGPFHERRSLGKTVFYFERPNFDKLHALGEVLTPSVSDLFVA